MSTDLERVLREGMERFTHDVQLRPGLAHQAARVRQRQRQRRLALATTAAGTAAVTAAAVLAVVTGGPGVSPSRILTTAYVARNMERALAKPMIEYTRSSFTPAMTANILIDPGRPPAWFSPQWDVRTKTGGLYQTNGVNGTILMQEAAFTASGRRVFTWEDYYTPTKDTTTTVIDANATWWRQVFPEHPEGSPAAAGQAPCGFVAPASRGDTVGEFSPSFIRRELACGGYRVTGHQFVNGRDALKLVQQGLGQSSLYGITLWVDPVTYLPLRALQTHTAGLYGQPLKIAIQTDFHWLPATPARLRALQVVVPAGYKHVRPPAP
ncbi:MAG TPA: hypothetical protein VGS19_38435 [Streptosporangiaceae bacterium]|nr:hypothetical protein [Streptosporangiaceae bacterium]